MLNLKGNRPSSYTQPAALKKQLQFQKTEAKKFDAIKFYFISFHNIYLIHIYGTLHHNIFILFFAARRQFLKLQTFQYIY